MRDFENRIAKVFRHRRRWARRVSLTAFRVYDRDIPGHRCAVDWYDGHAVVTSYPSSHPGKKIPDASPGAIQRSVARALEIEESKVFVKVRVPRSRGRQQYQRLDERGVVAVVEENGLRLVANLSDFNDTGLFLDHRETRARLREEASGRSFLNLFCYTGSFTLAAAAGGASSTTSVDLSKSYLEWARDNLAKNALDGPEHEMIRADVLRWLRQNRDRRYELAVLDPPSFSVSKKMTTDLRIDRDHPRLIADTLALLSPAGILYFSTNYRGFELDEARIEQTAREVGVAKPASIEETTPGSIPPDFRDKGVHRCFRVIAGGR